jgi:hypothetical protein
MYDLCFLCCSTSDSVFNKGVSFSDEIILDCKKDCFDQYHY